MVPSHRGSSPTHQTCASAPCGLQVAHQILPRQRQADWQVKEPCSNLSHCPPHDSKTTCCEGGWSVRNTTVSKDLTGGIQLPNHGNLRHQRVAWDMTENFQETHTLLEEEDQGASRLSLTAWISASEFQHQCQV